MLFFLKKKKIARQGVDYGSIKMSTYGFQWVTGRSVKCQPFFILDIRFSSTFAFGGLQPDVPLPSCIIYCCYNIYESFFVDLPSLTCNFACKNVVCVENILPFMILVRQGVVCKFSYKYVYIYKSLPSYMLLNVKMSNQRSKFLKWSWLNKKKNCGICYYLLSSWISVPIDNLDHYRGN